MFTGIPLVVLRYLKTYKFTLDKSNLGGGGCSLSEGNVLSILDFDKLSVQNFSKRHEDERNRLSSLTFNAVNFNMF